MAHFDSCIDTGSLELSIIQLCLPWPMPCCGDALVEQAIAEKREEGGAGM
jgi:hypothetical protein